MPGGHSTFFAFLNTFIHVVMYTYYMMAAIGPEMQKYLWWKKYLTILQMIQFCGISTHAFQLFIPNPCQYPIVFSYWIGGHGVLFFFLFKNFYKQAYKPKDKQKIQKMDVNGNAIGNGHITSEMCSKVQDMYENLPVQSNGLSNGITSLIGSKSDLNSIEYKKTI
jgi:elongation of very long chain fatty acids protein 7